MSNKFLNSNSANLNLNNGSVDIYAMNLGASSLSSSMPIKTNSTRQLVSTKLDITDTNNLQSTLNTKADKVGTEIIQAGGFKIAGGTNVQYLTADGGFGYPSGGGSSNIYLYDSSTNTTMTPASSQIRYNNADQKLATQVAVSHLTRDAIDIDSFLSLVTQTTIIYIQDQGSSVNWIRYTVNGTITVIPNNYYVFTVVYLSSEGSGGSGFGDGQDIALSFFTNDINNNSRLNTLETKTQYLASSSGNTTLTNDLTLSNTIIKGVVNIQNNKFSFGGYNIGTLNNISNNVVLGYNAGTTSNLCQNNVLIGQNVGSSLVTGNDNIGIGDGTIYFTSGNKNIHIGSLAGITTSGNNNICIGHEANANTFSTGNDNIYIGQECRTSNTTITNSINIGSNIIATNSNEIIIGNSSNDNLKMGNSNGFFTGKFRTSGGVSSEFLKANGTVDTNTYITSSSLSSYLLKSGGTMTGDININNNYITGCKNITFNSNYVSIGSGAGFSAVLCTNVGPSAGGVSQGVQSVAVGYASGNSTQGVQCVAVGPSAGQISQADYSVAVGLLAGYTGQLTNSVAVGVEAGYSGQGNNSVAIGRQAGNVSQGSVCIAIGAFAGATSQSPSSIILNATGIGLNSSTSGLFIKPIRNDTSSNTILYNSSTGELTYIPTPLVLNITNSATLFYNGATLTTSNSGLLPIGAMTLVGGLPTQVAQVTTTNKGKIFKTLFPESSVASFQDSGLLGNNAFLLNSQALYVGMGWNIKISFGIADTNGNSIDPSPAGMFVGLVSQFPISWSALINPATLLSCIGVGHNYGDSFISVYHKGSVSGSTNSTIWNTATPDTTRWFHLSMTNLFNSNDIILTLTETVSNVSETRTFTCGTGNSALATNIRLYPCIQRIIGNTASSGSGRIHLGQFTYNQLI